MSEDIQPDDGAVEVSGITEPVDLEPVQTPLGDDGNDEPVGDQDNEPEGEEEGKKRTKRASQRIDELTRNWREAERRNEELNARLARLEASQTPTPANDTKLVAPDPEDAKYEFGEADPAYLKDLVRYELKAEREEQNAANKAKDDEAATETNRKAVMSQLDENFTAQLAKGSDKYEDFDETYADLKATTPCPPLMAVAIQASPVAADVVQFLGKNKHEAEALAAQILTGDMTTMLAAAERFGAIEGQFLDKLPERPSGANVHPIDLAAYAGRIRAFVEKQNKPVPVPSGATSAPEPPQHRVRGASGQFTTRDDTDDLDAFSQKFFAKGR